MDLNETSRKIKSRHPWEISRTKSVLESIKPYLSSMHMDNNEKKYINVGAGDLYFDYALICTYKSDIVYAVDIGYTNSSKNENNAVKKFNNLEEIEENHFDYALMMDSLEYMENDIDYIKKLSSKIKRGGYIFFTLPAFQKLYSEHDIIVKNLRRYDRKSFNKIICNVPGVTIIESHYFYFSLLCIRCIQVGLHLTIDPDHKVTTGWNFKEDGLITKLVTKCLNLDFVIGRILSKCQIFLPGLSLFVVCKKDRC